MNTAGWGLLLRHAGRRDRWLITSWVSVLATLAYASAVATPALFSSLQQQMAAATVINRQPALVALYGPILDVSSTGELAMSKMTVLYAVFAAVVFVVLVRRHTRVEEETGRAELVGATAVGRNAAVVAVLTECVLLALIIGGCTWTACVVGGLPVAGAAWFALSWVGTGLVATGVALVACQLSASARTCAAVAASVIGAAYAARAVGDTNAALHWLSWASPLGWNTQLRAWYSPREWVIALYPVASAALAATALAIRSRRDLGAGVIPQRPGRAQGRLRSPWGLAIRLHRLSLALWAVTLLVIGYLFGYVAPGLDSLLRDAIGQQMVDRLGGALMSAVLSLTAVTVTGHGISLIGAAAADEESGRAEMVLATAISRRGWAGPTAALVLLASTVLMSVTGIGLALGYGAGRGADPWRSLAAAWSWLPAIWCVLGVFGVMYGRRRRAAPLGWAVLGGCVAVTLIGHLLKLPTWIVGISPYSDISGYPAQSWNWTPIVALLALAFATSAVAWWQLRARDIG
ncbi:exporter of polyketide antibiotics [Nocardioides baekrokdamisoli]|uniref:Exporter of polyketide antibiotics n=1 Tax=Nocardioides baekrokdamisoli TaxID=1804624 RepID=A0A3G9IIM7_9ACTN|nr:hypothetical protein [Nocardioides baekrokdamisoli]BBH15895.1 exporter of polyketide antibiotics [Nocardioides baekrokdamisoli]